MKGISASELVRSLQSQRYFILALEQMGLNPTQLESLQYIYTTNQQIANQLGVKVPSLAALAKEVRDTHELIRLYNLEAEEEN